MEKSRMTFSQKTFGNQNDWAMKKMKVIVTNPEGTITLKSFDEQHNRLTLVISLFPEFPTGAAVRVFRSLLSLKNQYGDCPDDENFWVWFVSVRQVRVSTMHNEFMTIFRYLQLGGYYSKSFKPMLLNYRLKQRDGARKADVVLTEEEIGCLLRKTYDLSTATNRLKQKVLDIFILALFTGARVSDVRFIVKSTDKDGNPILMFHNKKGTRTQTVAWSPAVQGALDRELYKTMQSWGRMNAALKLAMFEALPSHSNRLINYYYLKPGRGRELRTDSRILHISFHVARHTFCTRLLRVGISPSIVAQLAGHKTISTTLRYYNWTLEEEANEVLRDAYGANSLINNAPEWGEGARKVKPLPQKVHQKQVIKASPNAKPASDISAPLNEKIERYKKKHKPSKRRLEWLQKCRDMGVL